MFIVFTTKEIYLLFKPLRTYFDSSFVFLRILKIPGSFGETLLIEFEEGFVLFKKVGHTLQSLLKLKTNCFMGIWGEKDQSKAKPI